MLAWHFLSKDKRLGYDDGRLVEVGVPLECEGKPALCNNGMHGSVRLIDALGYASGPILCRVEIDGDIVESDDKLCGRRRTVLWMLDATELLHEFACLCAEDALALIDNPDPRSVAAIAAKRRWLEGDISDDELDTARAAADEAAAWTADDAARAAAWAANAAAWWAVVAASRRAVAWVASRDAADAAAWAAARAANDGAAGWAADDARRAAISKQDARLTEMVMEAHEDDEE